MGVLSSRLASEGRIGGKLLFRLEQARVARLRAFGRDFLVPALHGYGHLLDSPRMLPGQVLAFAHVVHDVIQLKPVEFRIGQQFPRPMPAAYVISILGMAPKGDVSNPLESVEVL
jgi:hypothetical protein